MYHSKQTGCAQKTTPYVAQTGNNSITVILMDDLYYCLLPQCEALCTCNSGFATATKWCCDQDVKAVPGATFVKRTCGQCDSLQAKRECC